MRFFGVYECCSKLRKFELQLQLDYSIELVKERIYDLTGFPCDQQRLFCGGVVLHDGTKMWDYNLCDNASIVIELRLRGPHCEGCRLLAAKDKSKQERTRQKT